MDFEPVPFRGWTAAPVPILDFVPVALEVHAAEIEETGPFHGRSFNVSPLQ